MELRSLSHRTDMIFHRFDGIVTNHGDYISVETPGNPGYFWGNYLIFSQPPKQGDFTRWRQLFRDRFAANPAVRHEVYTWENQDITRPEFDDFLKAGFRLEQGLTMAMNRIRKPFKWNNDLSVRQLRSDDDWAMALENQVVTHRREFGEEAYRDYRRRKNDRYRKMIGQGLGVWFGGFLNGKLIGDLGLFRDEDIGRFQLVSTHPEFRRQGVCSTLFFEVCRHGLANMGLNTLVIAADENYFAKNIYESVGFETVEHVLGLELRPPGVGTS